MRSSLLAESYLTIPPRESLPLGGMQWSRDADAIEDADGRTVCLVEELQEVLHGAFASGTVPHFVHLLYLVGAIRFGGSAPAFDRLRKAYAECSTAAAVGRNTGRLIAHLCAGFALMLHPPSIEQVMESLASRRRYGLRNRTDLKLYVALQVAEAVPKFAQMIDGMGDEDLRHWFRFGRPGLPSDERPVEELESLPVRVLKLIAAARTSPRMVGAASLIPALDAGLTIPPRKRSPDAVPQGGYADVTTCGNPDQLLPSQFALDPDEFVRRFAERELLYFQREEPHESQKPDRVLVFDQGVRTWGRVRLALAGAVLSLLKFNPRRVGDVRLHVTSQREAVALRHAPIETLSEVLEASDFTTDPNAAFERAIADPCGEGPRDLIVLTQPRNVPSLIVPEEMRRPGDRYFAFAVDEDGAAKVGELRDEGMVWLRSFRLDLQSASEERVETERPPTQKRLGLWTAWKGDVEPIGFPFRPGLVSFMDILGFTAEGDWLVASSPGGTLYAIAGDGSGVEVLPRAFKDNGVSRGIRALLPVAGGIVAVGITTTGYGGAHIVRLAHYDFVRRELYAYEIGSYDPNVSCVSWPERHCVIAYVEIPSISPVRIVDLKTREVVEFAKSQWDTPECTEVLRRPHRLAPFRALPRFNKKQPGATPEPCYDIDGDIIRIVGMETRWEPFLPRVNGEPFLKDSKIRYVVAAGQTLAVALCDPKGKEKLMLFRAPDGRILAEFPIIPKSSIVLSPDGERVAFRRHRREIVVHRTAETRSPEAVATLAKLHDHLQLTIAADPFLLQINTGGHEHFFKIQAGRLVHEKGRGSVPSPQYFEACEYAAYDDQRFPGKSTAVVNHVFHAVHDRLGLVHLIANNSTLVASFCVRRELAAAWIPGGVYWGAAALIGGPPHPDAAKLIGEAIRNAGGAE